MLSSTRLLILMLGLLTLSACTVAKLEARLEANPQCKDVINPKTGTVMPCPGSDKSFYRSVGLEPQKVSSATSPPSVVGATAGSTPNADSVIKSNSPAAAAIESSARPPDCKPQIHKKLAVCCHAPSPINPSRIYLHQLKEFRCVNSS